MHAEWIILTVVACIVISKLMSVLGREPVQHGQVRPEVSQPVPPSARHAVLTKGKDKVAFDEQGFLLFARLVFGTVVEAFAAGRKDTLQTWLSKPVLEAFIKDIDQRQKLGQKVEFSLISIPSAKIVEKKENPLTITVAFNSEQVNALKDKDGRLLEGDPLIICKLKDIWTFEARNSVKSIWVVTETHSEVAYA